MPKKEKKVKIEEKHNFIKEYSEIFSILGFNAENIKHEWNKDGDSIQMFTLYEDHPRPILTQKTHTI